MSERIIRHRTLPISAPESFWRALGWTVYAEREGSEINDIAGDRAFSHRIDEMLALAIVQTGANDERCLAWAIAESQRRTEEQTRSTALAREAESLGKLAEAIKTESESSLLSRIMGRLTEKTQWALRQQLAGSGLLPK